MTTTTQDPWEDAQRQLERYVRERNEARADRDEARAEAAKERMKGAPPDLAAEVRAAFRAARERLGATK